MDLSSLNFYGGFRKIFYFFKSDVSAIQGHPSSKVIDFVTNRKCICDFLLVPRSNFGPILHRFGDIAGFTVLQTPPLFHPNFGGCSRWTRSLMLGSMWGGTLSNSAVKLFSKYFKMCENHTSTSQTDRRTDGHRALRSIAR